MKLSKWNCFEGGYVQTSYTKAEDWATPELKSLYLMGEPKVSPEEEILWLILCPRLCLDTPNNKSVLAIITEGLGSI